MSDISPGVGLIRRLSCDDGVREQLERGRQITSEPRLVGCPHGLHVLLGHRPPSIPEGAGEATTANLPPAAVGRDDHG
jgi:hypothetical protein